MRSEQVLGASNLGFGASLRKLTQDGHFFIALLPANLCFYMEEI